MSDQAYNPYGPKHTIHCQDVPTRDEPYGPGKLSAHSQANQEDNALIHHALTIYRKYCQDRLTLLGENSIPTDHDIEIIEFLRSQVIRTTKLQKHWLTRIIHTRLIRWS